MLLDDGIRGDLRDGFFRIVHGTHGQKSSSSKPPLGAHDNGASKI